MRCYFKDSQAMTYNRLLRKAKSAIQKWARMRDADANGIIRCCCCGQWRNWKNSDGAHFIPATYLSTCFSEININACCLSCNRFKEGNRTPYRLFMIDKYGLMAITELEQRQHLRIKYHAFELEAIAKLYTDKLAEFSKKNL